MPISGRQTALAVLSVLGALVFCEAASRAALSVDPLRKRIQGGQNDASNRLRWVEARKARLGNAHSYDVHHPLYGWALRPNIRDMRVFGGKVLNSNSLGLRGRREYAYQKPPGVLRLLVLGDSFTFGQDVSDDDTYCRQLEQRLPGAEVLNFGVHGYGHDQMLLYLREEGVKYRPDVVLLGFLYDDMERNLLGFRDYSKPRFEQRGDRLELRNVPVTTPEETLRRELYRSKFLDLWVMLRARWEWRTGASEARMKQLTRAILDDIARVAREVSAQPAFAYLPVWGEHMKEDLALSERERFFFDYCRERGIPALRLQPFFLRRRQAGAAFRRYGHWGALEHQTAAEGIAAGLRDSGLLGGSTPLQFSGDAPAAADPGGG
jgi:hypothetical protein